MTHGYTPGTKAAMSGSSETIDFRGFILMYLNPSVIVDCIDALVFGGELEPPFSGLLDGACSLTADYVVPWTDDAPFNPKLLSVGDLAKCRPRDGEQEHSKPKE